MKKLIEMS